jgi:hypothetical protein
MSRFVITATVLFGVAMSAAAAFNVSLSGTVKKDDGSVLSGAKVNTTFFNQYFQDRLADTSDAQGRFSITADNVSSVRLAVPARQSAALPFKLRNNAVIFSPALGTVSGKLAVHSADGREVFSTLFSDLRTGCQGIMLPRLMPGMNVMRLSVAGNLYTQELLCAGNAVYSKSGFGYNQKAAAPVMAKRVAIVDTLITYKKDRIDGRIPLDSYTKSNVNVTMPAGVLKTKFAISNTMIPNWKMMFSTLDSSFSLWSPSDLNDNIDGGFEFYTSRGMLQAADIGMIGPKSGEVDNTDPLHPDSIRVILARQSFIMDFGTEANAKAMYEAAKGKYYDKENGVIPGYDTATTCLKTNLAGITVYSYYKQFYFDYTFDRYPDIDSSRVHAKLFLDYWRSKAQ